MVIVSSYNTLHSGYAEKYQNKEGIDPETTKSNWNIRLPYIIKTMKSVDSDVYFLQEVNLHEYYDIFKHFISDYKGYISLHPDRRDGVAILIKNSWKVNNIIFHKFEKYSNISIVTDTTIFTCVHIDFSKQGIDQLKRIFDDLKYYLEIPIVIGGDFNRDFIDLDIMRDNGFFAVNIMDSKSTCDGKKLDWIFTNNETYDNLIVSINYIVPETGYTASDHLMVSTDFQFK